MQCSWIVWCIENKLKFGVGYPLRDANVCLARRYFGHLMFSSYITSYSHQSGLALNCCKYRSKRLTVSHVSLSLLSLNRSWTSNIIANYEIGPWTDSEFWYSVRFGSGAPLLFTSSSSPTWWCCVVSGSRLRSTSDGRITINPSATTLTIGLTLHTDEGLYDCVALSVGGRRTASARLSVTVKGRSKQ